MKSVCAKCGKKIRNPSTHVCSKKRLRERANGRPKLSKKQQKEREIAFAKKMKAKRVKEKEQRRLHIEKKREKRLAKAMISQQPKEKEEQQEEKKEEKPNVTQPVIIKLCQPCFRSGIEYDSDMWPSTRHRHYLEFASSKMDHLLELMDSISPFAFTVPLLIFVRDQQRANDLVRALRERDFISANTIAEHEPLSMRLAKAHLFSVGAHPILVLTDAAARDLRLPQVAQVVHCDLPRDIAVFEQRNALVARCGVVMTLIDDRGRDSAHILRDLVQLLEEYEQPVPPPLQDMVFLAIHGFPKHLVEEKGFQPARDEALHLLCLMDDDTLLEDMSALTIKE